MKVWLVRYIVTDQQNDHVIGIFDDKDEAKQARDKFERDWMSATARNSSHFYTDIEKLDINKYYDGRLY